MKTVNEQLKVQRMTEIVWGLDWKNHLPENLGVYILSRSNFDEFSQIKNNPDSFLITSDVSNDTFVKDVGSASKEEYLKNISDFFTISKNGVPVGVVVCEIKDWSTYYLRFIFVAKEHRNHQLTSLFVEYVEKVLRQYSVEKISCDVSPSNLGQVARMSQSGYVYTGNILSERFGATMRLTKFLKDDSWLAFNKNFIQMFYSNNQREAMKPSLNV